MNVFQVVARRDREKTLSVKERLFLVGRNIRNSPVSNRRSSILGKRVNSEPLFSETELLVQTDSQLEEQNMKLHKKFVIRLKSRPKAAFDAFMDVLIIYSLVSGFYLLAFAKQSTASDIFDTIVWVFFIIDFLLNFITEVKDRKGRKISNIKLLVINYAGSWMVADILALLPFRYAGYRNAEYLLRMFRLPKASRIFRLMNIGKVSEMLAEIIYENECQAKKKLKLKVIIIWELIIQVTKIFFITYVLACLWDYYVYLILDDYNEFSNFYDNFNLRGLKVSEKFIRTWYFIFTTLSTVGYGDFYATNKFEMGFAILLVLAGTTWFAFTMGKAIQLMNSYRNISGSSEKKQKLDFWISSLENAYKPLDPSLKERISTHYSNYRKADRLGSVSRQDTEEDLKGDFDDDIINQLPNELRKMILDHLFSDIFYKFQIFFSAFIQAKYEIAYYLRPRIFRKNEIILDYEEDPKEIVLVASGVYDIGIEINGKLNRMFRVGWSSIIGDYYVFTSQKSFAKYTAVRTVKGFSFEHDVLKYFWKKYSINVNDYCEKVGQYHKSIQSLANQGLAEMREETKEADPGVCLKTGGILNQLVHKIASSYVKEPQEINGLGVAFNELDSTSENIQKYQKIRSTMATDLKDKLALFLLRKNEADRRITIK